MKQITQIGMCILMLVLVSGVVVAAEHSINIQGSGFGDALTIQVGDTVTWVNKDPMPHTVTADEGEFDSGQSPDDFLQTDGTFSHTFNSAGEFSYTCVLHPMSGRIIVEEDEPEPAPSNEPENSPAPPPPPPQNNEDEGPQIDLGDEEGFIDNVIEVAQSVKDRITNALEDLGLLADTKADEFLDKTARKASTIVIVKSGKKEIVGFKDNPKLRPNQDSIAMVKFRGLGEKLKVCSKVEKLNLENVQCDDKGAWNTKQSIIRGPTDVDIWNELTRIVQLH